jgi:hypothetical protein
VVRPSSPVDRKAVPMCKASLNPPICRKGGIADSTLQSMALEGGHAAGMVINSTAEKSHIHMCARVAY